MPNGVADAHPKGRGRFESYGEHIARLCARAQSDKWAGRPVAESVDATRVERSAEGSITPALAKVICCDV